MPDAPDKVLELVATFRRNADEYRNPAFNEAMGRQQFIDPLFRALGWDMDNEAGYAEAYKDVIHEASLKIGDSTKAPDYCFRVGGTPKFYLEAKKPAVNIKDDPVPAYQLRRYGWSRKLPVSILTDFEEFAVYDCRIKPAETDKASAARILYFRYEEYETQWPELVSLFSKDAILKGAFDRYAESKKARRGTATVDTAFLAEIEAWRLELAKNIALRNGDIGHRELNYAVQMTIDRIIFLRMCEDRGIEAYGQLRDLTDDSGVYPELCKLFRKADQRYNSGLFHFDDEKGQLEGPDSLTPHLAIDDKVLKPILAGLYYPKSPYEFSVMPTEILGQVYEQFLGKVIRLTPGHAAKVEEKPEVKKAGGVYYTPTYIVDYIVKNTVGKLLDGKSPKQAGKLTVLDPACGSGSFLLGAYSYLLQWHLDWYTANDPKKHPNAVFPATGGWKLTTVERKRILVNNIYGVDIDTQAVEVTKLSLLLKVLEGESRETITSQMSFTRQRALPDMAGNIKCGNSLIGPDFYIGHLGVLFDDEEKYRINVFDWKKAFPAIMTAGGFDAVIGNPPWGQKEIHDGEVVKRYIIDKYPSAQGIYDLFRPFIEQGVQLLRTGGGFGMVLPDIVLLKDYVETRRFLLENLSIDAIDWWGMAFASAVIDAATITGIKATPAAGHHTRIEIHDAGSPLRHEIPQADFWTNPRYTFNLHMTPAKRSAINQLASYPRLESLCEIHEGVHSGNIREDLFIEYCADDSCRKLYFGRDEIVAHSLIWKGRYIRLSAVPEKKTPARYANVGRRSWYETKKLLVRRTGDYVLAAVDSEGYYASNNYFVVIPKADSVLNLAGLCALMNSSFMTWYFRTIEPRRGRVFAELKIKHLSSFPIPDTVKQRQFCSQLNALGHNRAKLAARRTTSVLPPSRTISNREVAACDSEIDRLVEVIFDLPSAFRSTPLHTTEISNGLGIVQ